MTLQPPGMPPGEPPGGSSRYSRGTDDQEARLLNLLAREGGSVERKRLYSYSGLTATQFDFWLHELQERGIVERDRRDGKDLVVLRRNREQ